MDSISNTFDFAFKMVFSSISMTILAIERERERERETDVVLLATNEEGHSYLWTRGAMVLTPIFFL